METLIFNLNTANKKQLSELEKYWDFRETGTPGQYFILICNMTTV